MTMVSGGEQPRSSALASERSCWRHNPQSATDHSHQNTARPTHYVQRDREDKMALADSLELSLWQVGEEWEEGEVVCLRYWVALGILSVAALSSDSLPKLFPGYFLAKGLLLLWTVYSKQPGSE